MRSVRMFAVAVAASAIAISVFAGETKTELPGGGTDRQLIQRDDPTNAGSFDGTWLYVNRDAQYAMWIRTKDGVPQVRLQYQSLAAPEAFETDWDGEALYYMAGNEVTFGIKLGKSGADRITGKWSWLLEIGQAIRRETADVVIYRTVYGRTLVMDFENYEKTITTKGQNRTARVPQVWNWIKLSHRELHWEELPF